jgi:hypothetical protein
MNEKGTLSEDSALYAMVIAFPLADEVFTAGFDAGMIWQGMWSSRETIQMTINAELRDGIATLAKNRGYHAKFRNGRKADQISVTLRKITPRQKRPARRARAR